MSLIHAIKSTKGKIVALITTAGIGIGALMALPAVEVLHVFSTNEFCGSCHTMEPMVETFARSVHGGNNSQGFVAECVDCHLPKSNVVETLYVKGTSGIRHLWGEYIEGKEVLDYEILHNKRTEFVYDSGCLDCHRGLEEKATNADTTAPIRDQVHQQAFANRQSDPDYQCASCHYDIAHPNLKHEMQTRQTQLRQHYAQEGNL
ncbi:cytochrome C [Vibrio sp. SM6]|uniref:Cytochrome c-type protein n=1 Tax=Vibrio agarilyticus TaxID=2726741 RepID=A0A7X8YFS1_9VIBR|nr:NapC/NirT family cytochrome c [Vibrio agarilyticus]NLS11949.1 cytochrome C [Vibrio agarilyticus]